MAQLPPTSAKHRPGAACPQGSRRPCQGISLAELLVGVAIFTVVVGAASRALVSLIRGDISDQQELNRRGDTARALGLLQDEILNAQRLESGGSLTALTGCSTTPQLILRGIASNQDISYGLRTQSLDSSWRGPAVLVRCGPPYTSNGSLDAGTEASPNRSEQVILDVLLASTGFTASVGGTGALNRSVQVSLSSAVSGSTASSLQVPINSNQVYGFQSGGFQATGSSCDSTNTRCEDSTSKSVHYRPAFGDTINGSSNNEDVVYFNVPRSSLTISGSGSLNRCINGLTSAANCTVQLQSGGGVVTIFGGDVLVFTDGEIRLPQS